LNELNFNPEGWDMMNAKKREIAKDINNIQEKLQSFNSQ
jgi:hypothetical protein